MFHLVPSLRRPGRAVSALLLSAAALVLIALAPSASRAAECDTGSTGGISLSSDNCKPIKNARLVNGKAIAPASAPARVKKVIAAANRIRNKPYIYGGGHSLSKKLQAGYDCSGSVSYALRAAGFVSSPMPSGGFINWKRRGEGRWITTYANGGHMYMVVAGLSFDTSNMGGKNGNRWSASIRSNQGFSERHPGNY